MIGAGTFINPLIKVVTTVLILGAVYLFFVKPGLDTTESLTRSVTDTSSEIQHSIREDVRRALEGIPGAPEASASQIPESAQRAQKLGACVTGAGTDVGSVERCFDRFSP